jgi:ATP-dependent RNA helicase DeaD
MTSAREPAASFADLGLSESLVAVVAELGYEEPTAVQRETIPVMLAGQDLVAQAATGTGKTAAFALPILQRLAATPRVKKKPRALVLVPTRELAMQVAEAVHSYGRGSGLSVVPIYGGASMEQQKRALDRGADIIVATPGRALDHLRRNWLALDAVAVLVLDEADEMLDMGFAEDLDALLAATPESRQTTLFSATMPPRIAAIARRHLKDAQRVTIAHEGAAPGKLPRVRQVAYIVRRDQKPDALGRVLDVESPASALVFCRTRVEVDALVETLNSHGYRTAALHGGLAQRQRDAVMARFRAGRSDLLVATDVAARGLDIKKLSHVVNYDLPSSSEAYVHRIGRTGRAGAEGTAISFVEPRERRLLRFIEQVTHQPVEVAAVPTVADLRARRLEQTRAALRERLLAGNLDDARAVLTSLAEEFGALDVAAAAVQLLQAAGADEREQRDIAPPPPEREPGRPPKARGARRRVGGGPSVRLYIGLGLRAGVRPGDLVGAITGESGIDSSELGAIEIEQNFSLVEVPQERAGDIIAAMKKAKLRGRKVIVRTFREL